MDTLSELLQILNNADKLAFRTFLKAKNKRYDVKNITLLNILETDDILKLKKLYTKENKDAYHALRKRLYDNLILFLSNKSFEKNNSEAHEALRLLVVARFLLENSLNKPAFKCLQKAEKIAYKLEQYSLLHEILQTKLQYIFLSKNESIEELSDKIIKNQELLNKETRLNMAYAVLREAFNTTQNNAKIINLDNLILEVSKKFHLSTTDFFSYKAIYQILYLANEYANIQQNFGLIKTYSKSVSLIIEESKISSSNQLYYHIYIMYYLANFSFRNRFYNESVSYLHRMHALMQQQNGLYCSVFTARFILLKSLNEHFLGNSAKALQLTETYLSTIPKKVLLEDVIDLQLCQAFFLAKLNDRKALKIMSQLMHTDIWYEKKMGVVWTIRKNMMEVLIHTQFNNLDFALNRLQSFKRKYKKYLLQVNELRVIEFTKFIESYLLKPEIINNQSFRTKILLLKNDKKNQDVFSLSFIDWFITLWQKN